MLEDFKSFRLILQSRHNHLPKASSKKKTKKTENQGLSSRHCLSSGSSERQHLEMSETDQPMRTADITEDQF